MVLYFKFGKGVVRTSSTQWEKGLKTGSKDSMRPSGKRIENRCLKIGCQSLIRSLNQINLIPSTVSLDFACAWASENHLKSQHLSDDPAWICLDDVPSCAPVVVETCCWNWLKLLFLFARIFTDFLRQAPPFPHVDQTTSFSPISRRCGMFIFMACTVWRWPWSLAGAVARPPKYYDIPLRKKLSHLLQCWNQGHLSRSCAWSLWLSLSLSLYLSLSSSICHKCTVTYTN